MSTTNTPLSPKILFDWQVFTDQLVDETTTEVRDGQPIRITQKVTKSVPTRFAVRQPTRRELSQASLFYKRRFNDYLGMGLMTKAMMINKFSNLTGGVLSEQEKARLITLAEKDAKLQEDLLQAMNQPEETKAKIQQEQLKVRLEYHEINSANQAAFQNTADEAAASQLNLWFIFAMTLIERNGQWKSYFEAESTDPKERFDQQETVMWALEDDANEVHKQAAELIATYVGWYVSGYASTTEQFKEKDAIRVAAEAERIKRAQEAVAKLKEQAEIPLVTPPIVPAAPIFNPTPVEQALMDASAATA